MRHTVGECLLKAGLINEVQLKDALIEQRRTGERIGAVLVGMHLVSDRQIATVLGDQLGFRFVDLSEHPADPRAVALIPKPTALNDVCIAVQLDRDGLTVALSDPLAFTLIDDLEQQTGCRIRPVVSAAADILAAIERSYPDELVAIGVAPTETASPTAHLFGNASDSTRERADVPPLAELVDLVVGNALNSKATDVHVEPTPDRVLVRHRLNGVLADVMDLPSAIGEAVVQGLKGRAGIDTRETRLPQEGFLRADQDGAGIEFRVSTRRTAHGERIVMRRREPGLSVLALDELGLSPTALELVRECLRQPRGIFAIAGPQGSGTRTTLAAAAQAVDGDVTVLGEIADAGTAAAALRAAQRGTLVVARLQADRAPAVAQHFVDLGAQPGEVASTLVGAIAQRLVRRLCACCRRQYAPSLDARRRLNMPEFDDGARFFEAVGCDQCDHTGYRGRIGIFEAMKVDLRVEQAAVLGMATLMDDGVAKVKSGDTTIEEVLRVVKDVQEPRALCHACGTVIGVEYAVCPRCGEPSTSPCPHCGRAVEAWQFCPYCARSAGPGTPPNPPNRLH